MSKDIVGFLTIVLGVILATLVLQNYSSATSLNEEWQQWKTENGYKFDDAMDIYRRLIFIQNYASILKHNAKQQKSYQMGVNQFTHLSSAQFDELFTSKRKLKIKEEQINLVTSAVDMSIDVPNDVDWEKQGKVSPVKNQGQCDAGYAFCSNSLGQSYSLMNKTSVALSEQQIVDCSAEYTTFGCSSGSRAGTLKFLQEKGVTFEAKYPYIGVKQACKSTDSQFKLTKDLVTANGCNQLKAQLAVSPLTVAVNTTYWQTYKSGILQQCGSEVNHDTFLVGFTEAAWRIKNSWGVRWGEYGYIRIRIGDTCGICSKPGFGFKI